jgi:hypothetical protein
MVMKAFYPTDIREEELKNKVANDWFADYDTTRIIGNIDFCVAVPDKNTLFHEETESIVWAESKPGTNHDIYHSFVQLLLTIGKARTFEKYLPPQYIGAFDCARFAFIPYHAIQDIFYQNDFNWNVTPSDHNSKEFIQLKEMVEKSLHDNAYIYNFAEEERTLRQFIKQNIVLGNRKTKRHKVSKNNFTFVYQRWCSEVKPSIAVKWDNVKKAGLLDADFFLADLLSKDGNYLLDNLYVLLKHDHYQFDRSIDDNGLFSSKEATFNDEMKAHISFWNKYERPPRREYWNYIVERRDLLVPQDVRERKGSFFTPQKWVELSQEYLEMELGENWQDEYYIWDCCAGTGNLLAGLTNKYRIWASTLDKADVAVMHERIRNGANLLESHVFQFDFLNDDFNKLPQGLQDIINNPEERKKLVIYINPPYAEAGSTFSKDAKTGVSNTTKAHKDYAIECGKYAKRELFVQFIMRIYEEIPTAVLAEFSKLKILQGPYFRDFRKIFRAKLGRNFLVAADTFDNVKGQFPIGFFIWHLDTSEFFTETYFDIYDKTGVYVGQKYISSYENATMLNDWLRPTWKNTDNIIGYLVCNGNDFQHQNEIVILSKKSNETSTFFKPITQTNVLKSCIYLAVRHCIEATWLNDRDQFLYPNDGWEKDKEFQADCLVYALFHSQNRISSQHGTNNWIPFTEKEVNAPDCFSSHFMSNFIAGKDVQKSSNKECVQGNLFENQQIISDNNSCIKDSMSQEAIAVMDVGRNIWSYYMMQNGINVNASFYDIKEYFKGRDEKGRMNASSDDECFNAMTDELRVKLNNLAAKIEAKVYEYGFLKA